jgi:hypothetical protein
MLLLGFSARMTGFTGGFWDVGGMTKKFSYH